MRGYRTRFPAKRPWKYSQFRKSAGWEQSRDWGGRFYPHNLYHGDLERSDYSDLIQGDPYRYLNRPGRYQQSSAFGQKIFYPRAPWQ